MATVAARQPIVKDSTNVVRLKKLHDEVTREWLADAIVTCTLFDATGVTPIVGADNLPVIYAAGSSPAKGEYRATLAANLPLTVGTLYSLRTVAIGADGSVRVFNDVCECIAG